MCGSPGFSGKAPENTRAIQMAMDEPFVHWMEIDVQLTQDGVPVVIHDYSVDRTTTGKGKVKDLTWRKSGGWTPENGRDANSGRAGSFTG